MWARGAPTFSFVMKPNGFKLPFKERKKRRQGDLNLASLFTKGLPTSNPRTTEFSRTCSLFVSKKCLPAVGIFWTNKPRREKLRCATVLFFHFYIPHSPCPLAPGRGGRLRQKSDFSAVLRTSRTTHEQKNLRFLGGG